jgi:hypothetical protein
MTLERSFKSLKKAGGRFAFEFFLEVWHDELIKSFQKYLAQYSPEGIPGMVKKKKFPTFSASDFAEIHDLSEHLERITPLRLLKFLAEARPDLAQAIQEQGMAGAKYVVLLREYLLDLIKHPEKAIALSPGTAEEKKNLVQATCDACGKSWPVAREDFDKITECPFCNHPQGEKTT